MTKFIIASTLLLVGLITAITTWTINNNTQQIKDIEHIINEKKTWRTKINDLITNMRATRVYLRLKCKYKQPTNAYEQNLARSRARIQLIKATIDAKTLLDQPTLTAISNTN